MNKNIAIGILIVVLIAFLFLILKSGVAPTDEKMIKHFYEHQNEIETLVNMSNQDSKLIRIAKDFTRLEDDWSWPRDKTEFDISEERWEKYRELFDKVGSRTGIHRSEDGSVYIGIYASGLVTGGVDKGYLHTQITPDNIVDSIDKSRNDVRSNIPIHKHITGNWYLYYNWDD